MTNVTPEQIIKAVATAREVFPEKSLRDCVKYAGAIAELAVMHDVLKQHPKGSAENRRLFGLTAKPWNAARVFAHEKGMPHPSVILKEMGYDVA
ncbi:MAG TPA: hypothetical protein VGL34_03385 [Steroidobacteraceae bacterium]|jgi:hypothetical protein